MALCAECDQVFFAIVARVAAKFLVVDFQVRLLAVRPEPRKSAGRPMLKPVLLSAGVIFVGWTLLDLLTQRCFLAPLCGGQSHSVATR